MTNSKVATALTCLCLLGSAGLEASPADDGSPPVIVLRGKLEPKKVSAPSTPGGSVKSQSKLVVYVLKLPTPVPARGLTLTEESSDPQKGFQKLELVCDYRAYPDCEAVARKAVSHPVRIVGQPARAQVESADQIPVVMHVRLITVLH